MAFATLDLCQPRQKVNDELAQTIAKYVKEKNIPVDQAIGMILGSVLGNTLVDEELEENLVVGLAASFDIETANPEHEIGGGSADE